jgi:hypothetical protein
LYTDRRKGKLKIILKHVKIPEVQGSTKVAQMSERKAIPLNLKLRLFSDSSGYCQKPDCLKALFPVEMGGDKHIGEMAHVIPHGRSGPRHEERPSKFDPDAFENLILLCPTCHTIVDKAPEAYPQSLMLEWKRNHLNSLAQSQGIKTYKSRTEVRSSILIRLQENKAIWEAYAPVDGSMYNCDPESMEALTWVRRMKSVILPNLYRIQSIIDANIDYTNPDEQKVIANYREHVRGLTERHICGIAGSAVRFPPEMENLFQ